MPNGRNFANRGETVVGDFPILPRIINDETTIEGSFNILDKLSDESSTVGVGFIITTMLIIADILKYLASLGKELEILTKSYAFITLKTTVEALLDFF
mmetsp:Transcript_8763/g.4748  ORF Transcript_8763/g.4748 Transcript_8763/m.4748 type:complete len:98 (+) Transcript_8763:34-327(+)